MPEATQAEFAQRVAFGARVCELRTAAGISQEDLAHRTGLDRSYVGQVERGERNVSLDNYSRIARALDAPLRTLPN